MLLIAHGRMFLFVAFLIFCTFVVGSTPDNHYADCGFRSLKNTNRPKRLTGGTPSIEGSWPWMVAVVAHKDNNETDTFGGTLIGDRWVLTSGRGVLQSTTKHEVFFGDTNLSTIFSCTPLNCRNATKVHVHESIDDLYDVAIIEMEKPVVFSNKIRPVCLAKNTPPLNNEPSLTLLGWGLDMDEPDGNNMWLQEKKMKFVDHASCTKIVDTRASEMQHGFDFSAAMRKRGNGAICAQDTGGKGAACYGDSGGPLMIKYGVWYQVGVQSWFTDQNCTAPNSVSGYTHVERICRFIEEKTRGEVRCHDPTSSDR